MISYFWDDADVSRLESWNRGHVLDDFVNA